MALVITLLKMGLRIKSLFLLRPTLPVSRELKCPWPLVRLIILPVLVTLNRLAMAFLVLSFITQIYTDLNPPAGGGLHRFYNVLGLSDNGRYFVGVSFYRLLDAQGEECLYVYNELFHPFYRQGALLVFAAA